MQTLLTIAGFDPSSGAGVTADLAVFAAQGMFGTACVTALTVQSTLGVRAVELVDGALVRETLDCLWEDVPAAGIKVGMLATEEVVRAVAGFVGKIRRGGFEGPVVVDPVMRSSSGRELLSTEGVAALAGELLPLVDWVTPNLAELGVLVGREIGSREEMEASARLLGERFAGLGVVATGGHLAGGADDLVLAGGAVSWLEGERIESRATHGTGCAFSSALICSLVRGQDGVAAAREAKRFVAEAIRRAEAVGGGRGPMNLYWPLRG